MCSSYVMLGLVKLDPNMSYDTQISLRKTCTHLIVTKPARVLQLQNAYALWRRKMHTRYGEAKHVRNLEKKNMDALRRTTKNDFSAWLGK